jgi:hypothetical protein
MKEKDKEKAMTDSKWMCDRPYSMSVVSQLWSLGQIQLAACFPMD